MCFLSTIALYASWSAISRLVAHMQGHALFTRAAGSTLPCPAIDFITGFNNLYAAAFDLPAGATIESTFGVEFGAPPDVYIVLLEYIYELQYIYELLGISMANFFLLGLCWRWWVAFCYCTLE